jgi:hypothetical protein
MTSEDLPTRNPQTNALNLKTTFHKTINFLKEIEADLIARTRSKELGVI